MATPKSLKLDEAPHTLSLLGKAILPKASSFKALGKNSGTSSMLDFPVLSTSLAGVKTNLSKQQAFARLCGYKSSNYMPSTWPHILAFPLHLSLLTHADFPLPLLGLVHIQNKIKQIRRISSHEIIDIHCQLSSLEETSRGIEFSINTDVMSAGQLVWCSDSRFLQRKNKQGQSKVSKARHSIDIYEMNEIWDIPENLGRQYARLSGDYNPIHLHAYSANIFGFSKAIVHGMWSKSRALASLEQNLGFYSFETTVKFKLPVLMPSSVNFQWETESQSTKFQLLDSSQSKPHLSGTFKAN